MPLDHRIGCGRIEGAVASGGPIQCCAQRVQIGSRAGRLPAENFGPGALLEGILAKGGYRWEIRNSTNLTCGMSLQTQ